MPLPVSEFKEIMTVVRPTRQPTRGQVGEVEERGEVKGEGGGMGGQEVSEEWRVGVKRDCRARMPES